MSLYLARDRYRKSVDINDSSMKHREKETYRREIELHWRYDDISNENETNIRPKFKEEFTLAIVAIDFLWRWVAPTIGEACRVHRSLAGTWCRSKCQVNTDRCFRYTFRVIISEMYV